MATKVKMKKGKTNSGWKIYYFEDQYHQQCSLQESSAAEYNAVWLGVDNTGPHIKGNLGTGDFNMDIGARMHLTQEHARALIPLLTKFVDNGTL